MDIEHSPSKKPHHLPYNFPNIWCPTHDYPIILACTRPDCKYPRIFLCSKCLRFELAHVNEHTPLDIFDEFVNYMAHDPPLTDYAKTDEKGLISNMDTNLLNYSEAVKEEQGNIKKILNEFNDVFQDKSEELVSLLETQLTAHSDRFQERYSRLDNELVSDDMCNAQILRFKEIAIEVAKIRSSEKQCEFLKQVLKKRQAWESASQELKELPKKSYEFYETLIAQQMEIEPKLQNKEELIEIWNKGLTNLIQKVLHQAQIGDKTFEETQYIWLTLQKLEDLELLCDDMLKPETLLSYKPSKEELQLRSDDIAENLAKLANLRALALDFSLLKVGEEDIMKSLNTLEELKQLKALEINLAGVDDELLLPELLKKIKGCKSLTELSLNLSQINQSGFAEFIEGLAEMKHLNDLNLNLSGNLIDAASIEALILSLRALKHLENLGLNFSGYSITGNTVDKKSSMKLISSLSELVSLRKFSLDMGYNSLTDDHFVELADNLKKIPSLRHLELVINNNKITELGARKLAKAFRKSHLNWLYLNAHSNDLSSFGVQELLEFLTEKRKWIKVEINLRNVGLNKSQANGFNQQFTQDNVKIIF